jgi:hypothetical protein
LIVPGVAKKVVRTANKFLSAQEEEMPEDGASKSTTKLPPNTPRNWTRQRVTHQDIAKSGGRARSALCVAIQKTVVTPTVLDLVLVIDIPCEATNSEDLIIDQRVYCVFWQREKDAHWKNTFDSFRQFFSPLTEQNSNRASSRTDHLRC